jgi:uncharacterized protein YciI
MKHFVVEIQYQVPAGQLAETVAEHRAFLQTGYDRGWLLLSGPQNPRVGGMVVARAPSLEELQAFFAADPYKKKGLAAYRFVEFDPVKRQPFMEDWVTGA